MTNQPEPLPESEQPKITPKPEIKTSPFLEKLMKANEKRLGSKRVYVGAKTRIIGIEPYSIALQYLMDLEVVPLQTIITIAGEPKTYKTSAMLDFCRNAMELEGAGVVINTEGKWSDSKAFSMLGELSNQLHVVHATSVESWQEAASSYLESIKEMVNNKKEALQSRSKNSEAANIPIRPVVIGVDSFTGSQSESIKEKVHKDGYAQKTFQDRALLGWQWLNTWSSDLVGLPVTLIFTQHLKDKIDGGGRPGMGPQKVTSGGSGTGFMCSLEIRVQNGGQIDKAAYEGCYLIWKTHFNSLGRDKRRIKIPYIETYDDQQRQKAYFDWDEALVSLIVELQAETAYRASLESALGGSIVEYQKTGFGKVYTCPILNIDRQTALTQEISASVLGKRLQEKGSEIRTKLKKALRIQPALHWSEDLFVKDPE